MAKYETMLVTSAKLDEETTTALVGKFKSLIEANGTIDGVDEWGKRRLAYPINKEDDGIYTLIHFTSGEDFPAELERVYRITDGVLRSLIIAKVEGMPEPKQAQPEAAKAEEAAPVAEKPATEEAVAEAAVEAEEPVAVVEEPTAVAEEPAAEAEEKPAAEEEENA